MKYWLHRITGGDNAVAFAHPLLFSHGYISIGWSDFSTDDFVKQAQTQGQDFIDPYFLNANWGLPKNRWNLWRFIRGMKSGDIVIVPTWGEFSVFKIADDKIYSNESIDPELLIDWNGEKAVLSGGCL